MVVELVGSPDHIPASFESEVGDDECSARGLPLRLEELEADRAEISGGALEVERELFGDHGPLSSVT